MTKNKNGSWRYQAVFVEEDPTAKDVDMNLSFSVCEIYLDEDNRLKTWTERRDIPPRGYAFEELVGDIRLMLNDVLMFKPVPFDSLYVGMTFEANDKQDGSIIHAIMTCLNKDSSEQEVAASKGILSDEVRSSIILYESSTQEERATIVDSLSEMLKTIARQELLNEDYIYVVKWAERGITPQMLRVVLDYEAQVLPSISMKYTDRLLLGLDI